MNLCIIGTGYVGLVTGTILADLGNEVICVDNDSAKIDMLKDGQMPIYEPGLAEIVERNVEDCRLSFVTDIRFAVRHADMVFIAVGTPMAANGYADLSSVREVAEIVGRNLNRHKIVVNKSTVPVGTGDLVGEIIRANRNGARAEFEVVSNPEFLREGNAVYDSLNPDRVLIGAQSMDVAEQVADLYRPLDCPVMITDVRSAEMIKYASNAFLATKISFVNAVSCICEVAGADVVEVAKGMGLDKRIGPEFLQAGLGYGGSCFGKDTQCLLSTAQALGYEFDLLKAAIEVNDAQPKRFVEKMRQKLGGLSGKSVAVLGLAFKPNTDDLRDAKSLEIIADLLAGGSIVRAYDPIAAKNAQRVFPQVTYCKSGYEALEGVDAAVLVTEWEEIRSMDPARMRAMMARPMVFDGRNALCKEQMERFGFEYYGIGRATMAAEPEIALAKTKSTP